MRQNTNVIEMFEYFLSRPKWKLKTGEQPSNPSRTPAESVPKRLTKIVSFKLNYISQFAVMFANSQ
jgi:hypothetical protein